MPLNQTIVAKARRRVSDQMKMLKVVQRDDDTKAPPANKPVFTSVRISRPN